MEIGPGTSGLIEVLGGVALLLWGLRMVRTGAIRALGSHLRLAVARATGNRFSAAATGALLTTLVQSSTAVIMLAGSFASRGLLTTVAGLALALGADVGTTVVAQVLSFNLGPLGPLLAVAGFAVFSLCRSKTCRNTGRILLGLALVLIALGLIVGGSEPVRQSNLMQQVIAALGNEPLLALLLGALLTWVSHSSLAMVLLMMSLVAAGDMPLTVAYLLTLGVNLGGPLPALVASLPGPPEGRRIAVGNLLFRLVGVAVALALLPLIEDAVAALAADPTRQIANFHTLFNIALAVVFLPLIGPAAKLVTRMVPKAPEEEAGAGGPIQPLHLREDQVADVPHALNNATREALRMGDLVFCMLDASITPFRQRDPAAIKTIERMDDDVDRLNEAIKLYLTEISRQPLSAEESRRCMAIFSFVTNLEHIGDIIDRNLMALAERKEKRSLAFSDAGRREIERLHRRLVDNFQTALNVFLSGETDLAEQLLEEKRLYREQEFRATQRHLDRLRKGYAESIETSAIHLDLLRDFKRINSHITAVVYPVLSPGGRAFSGDPAGDAGRTT